MPGKRVERLALKGMMGRDFGSGEPKSRKPKSLKVPMTANDGDNATSPKDSAWPGLYTEDAGIRRRSPQARDPSWRQGSQSSQAGALIDT